MTTHSGCVWDYPKDVALAFGEARGLRLIVASLQDDNAASAAVMDEIGDCTQCLRNLTSFLAGAAGSLGTQVAELCGADAAAAVGQFEAQLAKATAKLP